MARVRKDVRPFSIVPRDENSQYNLNIFDVIKTGEALSAADVSEKSRVPQSVTDGYINSCVKKDLLKISGESGKGLVKFNAAGDKVLGVGFSGRRCVLTAMNPAGGIDKQEEIDIVPFSRMKGRNKEMDEIIDTIRSRTTLAEEKFKYAGVALPLDMKNWKEKTAAVLTGGISRVFNCETLSAGEVIAAGYGEKDSSRDAKEKGILYMHMDIGSGVVIKKEAIFSADEPSQGRECLRPWEQFGIVQTARGLVNKGLGTSIVDMVDGDIDEITLEIVMEAAAKGDELALDLVRRSGLALGVRVAYLVNIFNTEIVFIGEGIEKKNGGFVGFVKESAQKFLIKKLAGRVKIVPGTMGDNRSSAGAASLCRRELFMEV